MKSWAVQDAPSACRHRVPPAVTLCRDRKRAQLLEQRRLVGPPVVVAVLPLSDAVDVQRLWSGLLAACSEGSSAAEAPAKGDAGMEVEAAPGAAPQAPLLMRTLSLADRRKVRFTFLPPPANRDDALAVVEVGKAAEVGELLGGQCEARLRGRQGAGCPWGCSGCTVHLVVRQMCRSTSLGCTASLSWMSRDEAAVLARKVECRVGLLQQLHHLQPGCACHAMCTPPFTTLSFP